MMEKALRLLVTAMPLLFAFGFLVPVIMQAMEATGLTAPFGLSPLTFALVLGGGLGLCAQIRGRWI